MAVGSRLYFLCMVWPLSVCIFNLSLSVLKEKGNVRHPALGQEMERLGELNSALSRPWEKQDFFLQEKGQKIVQVGRRNIQPEGF